MEDFIDLKRDTLAKHLRRHLEGEVRFDATSRKLYSTDASIYQIEPVGVVIPKSIADLVAVVQIAAETHTPIVPRGGGTSLSGQSIGPGIVVDCSKHINAVLDIDPVGRSARVQPGVVLDQFNRAAAPFNLQFGPDVATASRANLGGMIGNNSAGARSIVYGKTGDHVHLLNVILSDGSQAAFGPVSHKEWDKRAEFPSLEGRAYREVRQIVLTHETEIQRRFPRLLRRVSGYNLLALSDGLSSPTNGTPAAGLHQLILGSEGTLGFVWEAEVGLVARPRFRGLLVPQFATLAAAMDALAACLESDPSAIELMDHLLLDLAHGNLSLKNTMAAIQGKPKALLMVEFSGDDPTEVADRVERLQGHLRGAAGLTASVAALDPAFRDPLWSLRSAAMPLLYSMPGDRKPVTFVEDCAVAPARLPEFVARFREVLHRHGTDGAFYGHASVGCLHVRPVLNLKDQADVVRMRQIMEEISSLVLEFGGALSGEHGDGLARSEWNRKMYGDAVHEAFRQVKKLFDPHDVLNPGKIVDASSMTENLRFPPGHYVPDPPTVFDYSRQEGFLRSIELCNGSGVCRKLQGGTMCPSFQATLDEKDSTRGRANALRHALTVAPIPLTDEDDGILRPKNPNWRTNLRDRWLYDVLDLCLMCKGCKAECPSNVDMAKLKAEFLQAYYEGRSRPLGHWLMAHIHLINRLGALVAPLANWLQVQKPVRWLLEQWGGIDRRRSMPAFRARHFRTWFARHRRKAERAKKAVSFIQNSLIAAHPSSLSSAPLPRRVLLLDDCFTTFNEPHIGEAAVRVLERAGYEVELAGLTCCGRPMMSKGYLRNARDLVREQAANLAARIEDGVPILGLEPSCLLTLTDEWPELVPGAATRRIARAAHLADDWLGKQVKSGDCVLPLAPRPEKCVIHGHCHQKALIGTGGAAAALRLIPDLEVSVLDTGCCGMAGSFGFEKEHYDLSVRIAELSVLPALATSPEALVVAAGASCRHQILDLARRRALHPMEALAEQLLRS
ncbi:MAG: FAD-binding and (Fe-S)-binding domain-containing protein [Gemmataceae bacterium]